MKWISHEIETYLSAKEYVDTAVIPLFSVSLDEEMKQSAEASEFINLLAGLLERQFTGRILLLPPFTYMKNKGIANVLSDLRQWEAELVKGEFKHIFYLTSDIDWKSFERDLEGELVWIPSLPIGLMPDSQKKSVAESQVKQLLNLFTQKWHMNE